MNCPNCGAALRPVGNRDHYRCEYCETLAFPEGEGPDRLIGSEQDHKYSCPCCADRLKAARVEGKSVAHCAACRGILTRSSDFAVILHRRRARQPAMDRPSLPFDPTELRRVLSCPVCRGRMDTHAYGGGGNAVIDSCHRCQVVWLDAGELTVLERFTPRRPRR